MHTIDRYSQSIMSHTGICTRSPLCCVVYAQQSKPCKHTKQGKPGRLTPCCALCRRKKEQQLQELKGQLSVLERDLSLVGSKEEQWTLPLGIKKQRTGPQTSQPQHISAPAPQQGKRPGQQPSLAALGQHHAGGASSNSVMAAQLPNGQGMLLLAPGSSQHTASAIAAMAAAGLQPYSNIHVHTLSMNGISSITMNPSLMAQGPQGIPALPASQAGPSSHGHGSGQPLSLPSTALNATTTAAGPGASAAGAADASRAGHRAGNAAAPAGRGRAAAKGGSRAARLARRARGMDSDDDDDDEEESEDPCTNSSSISSKQQSTDSSVHGARARAASSTAAAGLMPATTTAAAAAAEHSQQAQDAARIMSGATASTSQPTMAAAGYSHAGMTAMQMGMPMMMPYPMPSIATAPQAIGWYPSTMDPAAAGGMPRIGSQGNLAGMGRPPSFGDLAAMARSSSQQDLAAMVNGTGPASLHGAAAAAVAGRTGSPPGMAVAGMPRASSQQDLAAAAAQAAAMGAGMGMPRVSSYGNLAGAGAGMGMPRSGSFGNLAAANGDVASGGMPRVGSRQNLASITAEQYPTATAAGYAGAQGAMAAQPAYAMGAQYYMGAGQWPYPMTASGMTMGPHGGMYSGGMAGAPGYLPTMPGQSQQPMLGDFGAATAPQQGPSAPATAGQAAGAGPAGAASEPALDGMAAIRAAKKRRIMSRFDELQQCYLEIRSRWVRAW